MLPIGLIVVPFWGSHLEFDRVIPKGTTMGPMARVLKAMGLGFVA